MPLHIRLRPGSITAFTRPVLLAAACGLVPASAFAQRELHWDRLDVAAHLEADGRLVVSETQTMVFTGDWNGGERTFDIRPRQQLQVIGVYRERPQGLVPLSQDSSLDDVDDYWWDGDETLRWRSRLPADPPFSGTTIRYRIDYELSGILLKDGDRYRLDHDFVFPDRAGAINQFELHLTFDPAWQPQSSVRPVYTAGRLAEGSGFVLDVPLLFSGTDPPSARDVRRPREIVVGVSLILGFTILATLWLFARERRLGRFAPLTTAIDEAWLAEHILKHPAEVVAAAWDENVGSAEVTSLIARMVDEGLLRSSVSKGSSTSAEMNLQLLVDRATLKPHERVLVDKLFVDGGKFTSTRIVRAHYKKTGFNPSAEIEPSLLEAVDAMLPAGRPPRRFPVVPVLLMAIGVVLIAWNWFRGYPGAFALTVPMLVLTGVGWGAGYTFRGYLHWGVRNALLCLLPAFVIAAGASLYLWFYAGSGRIELPRLTVIGVVALTLGCLYWAIRAHASRRGREAIAFRKMLTAGRAYFIDELQKDEPALRDEWYPWLLAFELTKQMDAWSTARPDSGSRARSRSGSVSSSPSTTDSGGTWTGFGGGRSGGAGGGASWQTAVSGMAAGVSAHSSGGSSRGSGGGGSSSGGSSGGGGGGGW
jgi:hypothetical protein